MFDGRAGTLMVPLFSGWSKWRKERVCRRRKRTMRSPRKGESIEWERNVSNKVAAGKEGWRKGGEGCVAGARDERERWVILKKEGRRLMGGHAKAKGNLGG